MAFATPTKVALVEALRVTFDAGYPVEDFRGITIGTEFPEAKQGYPGIWVDFDPGQEIQIAGIGHVEFIEGDDDWSMPIKRYTFFGTATFTVYALTSRERDRLYDEMVKVLAFGDSTRAAFREAIEANEWIGMNMDFDQVETTGWTDSPGTPWASEGRVYEATLSMNLQGDFASDLQEGSLVPLSNIIITPYLDGSAPPANPPEEIGEWQ